MKKILRFTMAVLLIAAAAVLLVPEESVKAKESVTAQNSESSDSVGNRFYTGETSAITDVTALKDVYMMGNNCQIAGSTVDQDVLIAGNLLSVSNTSINGSLRAAGYSIDVIGTKISGNITAAANSISIGHEVTADAAILAAQSIAFNGTCGDLKAYAENVTIDGTVTGDVHIFAENVTIGPNADIKGTLTIKSTKEPGIDENALIANLNFDKQADVGKTAEKLTIGAKIVHKLLSRLYWVPALVLIAFIFCLVFGKALDGSGTMLMSNPAVMLGSGAIALIALPVAVILCCITYIGLPLAGLLTLLVLPILFFSVTFTGAAVGRLVFKTLHPWLASLLGTAILVFVKIVPFLGGLLTFACIIFTLGYLIQLCYSGIHGSKIRKLPAQ
ncbi:MAG: polymer-forming cytoskeletal protein [Lachnospiraceae bacterium]